MINPSDNMDKKIIAILLVAIVIVAGVAAALVVKKDNVSDDKDKAVSDMLKTNLHIYGNVDGDDDLDSDDTKIISDIIKAGGTAAEYPLADANQDGVIDQKDVDAVKTIISINGDLRNGKTPSESITLYYEEYYENNKHNTEAVSYPVDTSRIGVYQYQAGLLLNFLGLWDNVTYADDTTIASTTMLKTDGLKSYGAYSNKIMRNTDGVEMFNNSDVTLLVFNGYYEDNEVKNALSKIGSSTQVVKPYSQGTYSIGSLVTFGFILGADKAASEYMEFYNDVMGYIQDATKSVQESAYKSFLMVGNPTDPGAIYIDTAGDNGTYPDVAWVLRLPTINKLPVGDDNRYEAVRSAEWFAQPENASDYIILSIYSLAKNYDNDLEAAVKDYQEMFKMTSQYANGKIIGFNYSYENGLYAPGQLALIAYYLYPDLIDEDKAWDYFETFFDKYDINGAEAAKKYAGVYSMTTA